MDDEPVSFFSRVSSIPIVQDSHQFVQQNRVGKTALGLAGAVVSQPYINTFVNMIGNKSLDIIERQCPSILVKPTNELVHPITEQVESMMNKYLPESSETLWNSMNQLPVRTSQMIRDKLTATAEEEKQLKKSVHGWLTQQVTLVTDHHPMQFVHLEIDKFRQELLNAELSHTDRIRNIWALSQTDILVPLYQAIWKKKN